MAGGIHGTRGAAALPARNKHLHWISAVRLPLLAEQTPSLSAYSPARIFGLPKIEVLLVLLEAISEQKKPRFLFPESGA